MLEKRRAGILLPVSCLPSPYGIGSFGKAAYDFVDFLKEAKQTYWQILPICPTSFGDSPYSSPASFAGNPYFIDLDMLAEDNLLRAKDYVKASKNTKFIDYDNLYKVRSAILKKAYDNFLKMAPLDYSSFVNNNYKWLHDYALFMYLKDKFNGASFDVWEDKYKYYNEETLKEFNEEQLGFYYFLQYEFSKQWNSLKQYANKAGIKIIGDLPIYVAYDSADVWASPNMFKLDKNLKPTKVAGCPPDAFSDDGQFWGNPLYNYKLMKSDGYSWWIARCKRAFELYDIVRLDHFRGFEAYWAIPASDDTAKDGKWVKGPNYAIFKAIKKSLGDKEFIAEDLGYLTESVYKLVAKTKFPGMKVIEFGFDGKKDNEHLPVNYKENIVAYIGTHDNAPVIGWYEALTKKEKGVVNNLIAPTSCDDLVDKLISMIQTSVANTVIIQMQDYLHLGLDARINTPSNKAGNWKWRLDEDYQSASLAKRIANITKKASRC
ncbi:MAG: 4-alpha-glucanotransferase [Bacilli bacterium]|nr:4-alpha-glucanotransferase [Bacilli bacterium]